MKKISTLSMSLLFLFLAACSSGHEITLVQPCSYSNGDDAPIWTCNSSAVLDFPKLRGVAWITGESRKVAAGRSFQQKAAVLDGRAKLMEFIQVRIESLLEKKAEANNAVINIRQVVSSFSEGLLKGSRIYTRAIDPGDGSMYVVVGINGKKFKQNVEENEAFQAMLRKIELDRAAGGKAAVETINEAVDDLAELPITQ